MTSNVRRQTTAIHLLANMSRSNDNQALKFGQLIRYNTLNIFVVKPYTKWGVETITSPFSKRIKIEHISESIV